MFLASQLFDVIVGMFEKSMKHFGRPLLTTKVRVMAEGIDFWIWRMRTYLWLYDGTCSFIEQFRLLLGLVRSSNYLTARDRDTILLFEL